MTNFSTRKILVGTDGAGSCLARVAVTRAAHSAGAGATTEIAFAAERRRGDEGDERLVLVVEHRGLDLAELRLEDVLDRLGLDAVPADLELRVDPAEEVHPLRSDVDPALCRRCGRDGRTEDG